jgi:hypothetical protein
MARKEAVRTKGLGRLVGAAKAVKKLFTRKHDTPENENLSQSATPRKAKQQRVSAQPERIVKRQTDIPFDVIDRYTPSDTSSKASFRSDGQDHHDDQEMALGVVDERWNDEDRFTNKSGDPRIGTHRRTYEPEEARAGSRE